MKKIILFITLLISFSANSQTKADYERVLGRFVQYYNNLQSDSIYTYILSMPDWENNRDLYDLTSLKKMHEQIGKIVSFKYIGQEGYDTKYRHMALLKVTYDRVFINSKVHAMAFSLDENNKIYGFNFLTTSEEIERMMKEN